MIRIDAGVVEGYARLLNKGLPTHNGNCGGKGQLHVL